MDDNPIATPESKERPGLGRRTVLTAAWSVPAISVLAAAPAMATSPVPIVPEVWNVSLTGRRVTDTKVEFTWEVASDVAIELVSISATKQDGVVTIDPDTFASGPSKTATFEGNSSNSAKTITVGSFILTLTFTYPGGQMSATATFTTDQQSINKPHQGNTYSATFVVTKS